MACSWGWLTIATNMACADIGSVQQKRVLKLLEILKLLLGLFWTLDSLFPSRISWDYILILLKKQGANVQNIWLEIGAQEDESFVEEVMEQHWDELVKKRDEDLNLNVWEVESQWNYAGGILVEVIVFFNPVIWLVNTGIFLKHQLLKQALGGKGRGFLFLFLGSSILPDLPIVLLILGWHNCLISLPKNQKRTFHKAAKTHIGSFLVA